MFRRRLLAWFRRNRRDLPWRSHAARCDAYRVWLSEVMLQQTRVAAVLPYYRRFLRRFPTVRALARAREDDVLEYWAGLGYYRRARNLHRAAKEIVARHGGRFPRELDMALALPGVGRYTAAAVLSIAYGKALAVLDGNVARVLARLGAMRGDPRAPRRWRELENTAQWLLAKKAPGDWNQAMMELGATVCTPRAPRCGVCSVSRWCRGFALGAPEDFPAPRKKLRRVKLRIAAAVLLDPRGRTLLVREGGGVFSRMWQFPAVEVGRDAKSELGERLRVLCLKAPEVSPQKTQRAQRKQRTQRAQRDAKNIWSEMEALRAARHSVTFREITLLPHLVRVPRLPLADGVRVMRLDEIERLPISNATRKIVQVARQHLAVP